MDITGAEKDRASSSKKQAKQDIGYNLDQMTAEDFTKDHSLFNYSSQMAAPSVQKKPVQKMASPEEEELQMKAATIQKQGVEEEELQMKKSPVQKMSAPEEEELQMKSATMQKQGVEEEELQMKKSLVQKMSAPEEEELQIKASTMQKQAVEEEELQMKKSPVQKMSAPEEEELQMKSATMQKQGVEEEELQMKKSPVQKKSGSGSGMPEDVQMKMESSFGTDFSGVNIHANDNSATDMGALAYTQGNDVHFAPGQYNPQSQAGQELLGHELTHVVQQRQGRVQATTQQKGIGVNDDPALEKEADDMGKKAAEGKNAEVAGKGNGVQMKEDDNSENIKLSSDWGAEKTLSGVPVKGEYYQVYYNQQRKGYYKSNVKKIINPTKSQWIEILKHGSGASQLWSEGFLKANNHGLNSYSWSNHHSEAKIYDPAVGVWYCDLIDPSPFTDSDRLNFLEALYGIDSSKNEVDLPNGYNSEGGIWAEKRYFPLMASFIEKYQPLLIKSVSERTKNSRLDTKAENIKTMAQEATPSGVFATGNPDVIIAMIQSAYASALSSAKNLLNIAVEGMSSESFSEAINDSDIVYNSGLIINSSIKAYEGVIADVNKNKDTAFDLAWNLIPFSKKIPEIGKDALKLSSKAVFDGVFSTKAESVSSLKNNMKSNFSDLKESLIEIARNKELNLNIDLEKLALTWTNLQTTFDAGLDD